MKRLLMPMLLFVTLIMTGCAYEYTEEDGYRMAVINEGFPVPKNAYELKSEDCTSEIAKSAKYRLKGIGDPASRIYRGNQRMGMDRAGRQAGRPCSLFREKSKIMSLIIQENVFDVFEMSESVEL